MQYEIGMPHSNPILLQHGWAFDKHVWDNWQELNPEVPFVTTDRGYFGKSTDDIYTGVKIAITHSLGLHMLPVRLYEQLESLVIISAFQEFHPDTEYERKYSQKVVRQMINGLTEAPETVLDRFYLNCFKPTEISYDTPDEFNTELLKDDLMLLNYNKIDINFLKRIRTIIILHGKEDVIVNYKKAINLHSSLPGSTLITHERGGHMLPVTNARWCLEQIKELF